MAHGRISKAASRRICRLNAAKTREIQTPYKNPAHQPTRRFRDAEMSATLPKMGRPSLSGLSIKLLGSYEYHRQMRERKIGPRPFKRRWTGLSHKLLGHAAYTKAWRKMRLTRRGIHGRF